MTPDLVTQGGEMAAAAIVLIGIGMAVTRSIGTSISLLVAQSLVIGLGAAAVGLSRGSAELVIGGTLTVAIRGIVLPLILWRLLRASPIQYERSVALGPRASAFVAIAIVFVAAAAVAQVTVSANAPVRALPASIAEVLTGLLIIATRRKSISMVVGLLVFENGIALAALSLTAGMPLVMELGATFDLLIVMVVVQVHARRMLTTFGSLSTDRLRDLRG